MAIFWQVLFGCFDSGLLDLLPRLNAGGADQDFFAVHAARLQIHILAALGGDVRVAAGNAGHESAFAVGALSGHILGGSW